MFQMKLLLKLLASRGPDIVGYFMANLISVALSTILISSHVRHKLTVQKPKIQKIGKNVKRSIK